MSSSTCKPPSVHPPPSAKAIYDAATEEERERALKYAEWLVKNYCAPSNEGLKQNEMSRRSSLVAIKSRPGEVVGTQSTTEKDKCENKNSTIVSQKITVTFKGTEAADETGTFVDNAACDDTDNISIVAPQSITNLSITSDNCHKINNTKSTEPPVFHLKTTTTNGLNVSNPQNYSFTKQNESFQLGSAISSPNKPVVDYRIKTSSEINATSDIHSVKCGQAVVAKHWDNGDMSPYIHSFKDVREGEALRELYRITLMQCAEQVFTAIAYELPRDHILLTMLDAQYQRKHKNTEECEESKAGEENGISTSSAVIPIPATTSQVSMRTAWLRVGEVIKEHLNDNETSQYHCLLSDISVLRSQMEEHKDQVRRLEEENRALREDTEVQRMRMKEEGERMRAELLRRLEEENRALREETNVERMRMKEEGERMRAEHLLGTTRLAEELECLKQQNEKISRELDSVKKKWKFEVTYLDERASIISTCQNEFSQTLFSSWCLLKEKQHDESIKKTHKMYMDRFSLMQRSKEIFVEASEEVHKTALRHKETPVNSLNVSIARSIAPSLDYSSEWNVTSDYGDIGRVNSPPIEKLAKMSNRRKQSGS